MTNEKQIRIQSEGWPHDVRVTYMDGEPLPAMASIDIAFRPKEEIPKATISFLMPKVDVIADPIIPLASLDRLAFLMGYRLVKVEDAGGCAPPVLASPPEEPTL